MDANEARHLAERIDTLLDEVQQGVTPAVNERVEELVRSLVGLYGAGLERTVELVAGPDEPDRLRTLAEDDLVGPLLVLHDLHPDDVLTRVQGALDRVRPYLGSHAGGVTLVGVDPDGVVRLRLEGSCDGCPSSAMTVQNAIEDAILTAAPDVLAVEVEGVVSADPPLLQIEPFGGPREGGGRAFRGGGSVRTFVPVREAIGEGVQVGDDAGAQRLEQRQDLVSHASAAVSSAAAAC